MAKTNKKSLALLVLSFVCMVCLCLSFVMGFAAAAGEIAPTMKSGAEVRTVADKSGIRFTAYIDNSYFADGKLNDGTVAGMIITKGEVEVETLTHASNKVGGVYAGAVLDIPATVWDSNKDIEGAKAFNAVVYNIPQSAYGVDLTARAYVGIYNQTTEEYDYIYSATACTYSIAEVASGILASGGYEDDAFDTLAAYVDGVNADFAISGNNAEVIELSLAVGQSIEVVPSVSNLTVVLTTESNLVAIDGHKITVTGYNASNAQVEIVAQLGTKIKNVIITVKNEFKDDNLAQNLIADFDEKYYIDYGVKAIPNNGHTYMHMNYMSAEDAQKAGVDATSGVVAVKTYSNYDRVQIPFGKTLTVSEITGIYIKIWVGANTASANNMQLTIGGVEHRVSNNRTTQGGSLIANDWNYIYVARNRLSAANTTYSGYNATTISEISFYLYGAPGETFYIDEVGIIDASAKENELINFDSAQDLQMNYIWGEIRDYWLSANDSACPEGATGGVDKISATAGNGSIHYFKQRLALSKVSKIIVRAYVPEGTTQFRVFSVSETGSYPNDIKLTAHPGQFYDYEIDISSWTTDLFGIRIHKTTDGDWFIDSITYVGK